MQLCRIPQHIFDDTVRECGRPGFCMNPDDIGVVVDPQRGVKAAYVLTRRDAPDRLNVSVDPSQINPFTDAPTMVGSHIDVARNVDVRYLVMNGGGGSRWHLLAPFVTREHIGSRNAMGDFVWGEARTPEIKARAYANRAAFVRQLMDTNPDDCVFYWLRLDASSCEARRGEQRVEAVVNAPVRHALHDGSTLGFPQSTAAFCATYQIADNTWPSVFD
jgi:hypothetical protein